jgi:hypothetical protein
MADGRGGYRQPANPAPVSGPGKLARRTDGGPTQPQVQLPDAKYGEQSAFQDAQAAAPMAGGPDLSQLVPMSAPTQRPDEPVQSGMAGGPGAGPAVPPPSQIDPQDAERLRSYLPVLIVLASSPDASPATKQYVRQLRGELG